MQTRLLLLLTLFLGPIVRGSDTLKVTSFRYSGPYYVVRPLMLDSLGVDGKAFDIASFLDTPLSLTGMKSAPSVSSFQAGGDALHLLAFTLCGTGFSKIDALVDGIEHYCLFVDGVRQKGTEIGLDPGTHEMVLKCLTNSDAGQLSPGISIVRTAGSPLSLCADGKKIFSLDTNTRGERCGGVSISSGGNCIALTHSIVTKEGKTVEYTDILRSFDGSIISRSGKRIDWMPSGDSYYYTTDGASGRELVCMDPLSGTQTILAEDLPEGDFTVVPGGRYLIFRQTAKGPEEDDVHQILTPDDRQPGWRDRTYLSRYDLRTGMLQPLTFGHRNATLCDVSSDGRKILFMTVRDRLTARPTTLMSVYLMDLETLRTDCIVEDDGFITDALLSPAADKVLVTGSPEAFGGAGNVTPEGKIPSMFDYQLYCVSVGSRAVTPLTRNFDPCVQKVLWNRYDGNIYFSAEVKDCVKLFRLSPSNGRIVPLQDQNDNEFDFDVSVSGPSIVYYGQGLESADRVFSMDVWKQKHHLIKDFGVERLDGVALGKGGGYEFTSSRGDVINGFYVLPPDFDPSKKYPMIVHYYGGCSPSSRYLTGSYSPQYYAAQGYVFYVVNPSGASGFGQEFSSRHVNTAGDGVAEDIIEATISFCRDHPFVDTEHIGCFSASYGGFMTQLLLTKTDIYATGISHAGISDHTSYWGEGYWGYNYSEVSMAGSYPWTRKDLYVDRSPLYNADKIHTPLLFLHGSADTNVPIGESIQMFTALKLLGQDTAFVVVDGENHGIREYSKRRQWLRTISAWFSKYLKEDPTWWDYLYPPKNL